MERKPYYDTDPRRPRPQGSVRRSGSAYSHGDSRSSYDREPRNGSRSSYGRESQDRGRGSYGREPRDRSRDSYNRRPQERRQTSYDRRPQERRQASCERRPQRRRRRDPGAVIMPILMVLAAIAIVVYVGVVWFTVTLNNSTYCDNVYINDISLTTFTREEGEQYIEDTLNARLAQTYTLTWEDQSWSFSALDFDAAYNTSTLFDRAWNVGHVGTIFTRQSDIRALKDNPVCFEAELTYDETLIDSFIEEMYQALYVAPVNAEVMMDAEKPELLSASTDGQALDSGAAKEQIITLIETGEGTTTLPVMVVEPDVSTELAESGFELIVEYKTDVSARNYNSRFNVRKALQNFNMTVANGETVSFNDVVGPRTEARGYREATEYLGNTTTKGYGGGVCQASTTLYGALLKAGVTIIERSPHSMTVNYVEPSLDAAVTDSGNNKDLVFRNDTGSPIFIYTEVTKEEAIVRIYGVRPPYRYELLSEIESQDSAAVRISYVDDTEGKYVYYTTDAPVLYKQGHAACTSNGYLVAYDWETGEEVSRQWLSHDEYASGTDVYWRGVHTQGEDTASGDTSESEN